MCQTLERQDGIGVESLHLLDLMEWNPFKLLSLDSHADCFFFRIYVSCVVKTLLLEDAGFAKVGTISLVSEEHFLVLVFEVYIVVYYLDGTFMNNKHISHTMIIPIDFRRINIQNSVLVCCQLPQLISKIVVVFGYRDHEEIVFGGVHIRAVG